MSTRPLPRLRELGPAAEPGPGRTPAPVCCYARIWIIWFAMIIAEQERSYNDECSYKTLFGPVLFSLLNFTNNDHDL